MASFLENLFHQRQLRAAFTVIELLLVMIIVSIVGLMVAPRFANSLSEQHVDAAARRMAADLALAQRRAKFTSTSQIITFDVAGDRYALAGVADPDHPSRSYAVNLDTDPYQSVIVSADFGGTAAVTFNGYGIPDSAGTLVVRAGGHHKTLTLNALTGDVTISDGDGGSTNQQMLPY